MASPDAVSREAALSQSLSIPVGRPNLACCCGRTSCVYLNHNNAALDDLEKDLRTAAQLGQVCTLWNPSCGLGLYVLLSLSLDSYLWQAFEGRVPVYLYSESGFMSKSLTFALQALLVRHEAYM